MRDIKHVESLEPRRLLTAAAAHLVADITQGSASGATYFSGQYAALGNYVYFAGPGGLWKSDGTGANTKLVKALVQTPGAGIGNMVAGNGVVYFTDNDGGGTQIWQSTGASTSKVTNFTGGEDASHLTFADNELYFVTQFKNPGVWRLTGGGAKKITSVNTPFLLANDNGKQYFTAASDDFTKTRLMWTDGDTVNPVKDFNLLTRYTPDYWRVYKGRLYFGASTELNDIELWQSDGTAGGTHLVSDILPGTDGSGPGQFVVAGGTLYFAAFTKNGGGRQFYSTTGGGLTKVTSLEEGSYFSVAEIGGTIYFTRYTPTGQSLYKLSGGTATAVPTGGTTLKLPDSLTPVGSTLFFVATGGDNVRHLYQTDGKTITPVGGDVGTNPQNLQAVKNQQLFYAATDAQHGTELHVLSIPAATSSFAVSLRANGHSSATVNEGEKVNFTTVLSGISREQVKKYQWDYTGLGALVPGGAKPTHLYTDDLGDSFFNVRCKVVFNDGQTRNAFVKVKVLNKAPELKIQFKGDKFTPEITDKWVPWHPMSVEINVKDVTTEDLTVVGINWGDGSVVEVHPAGEGKVVSNHVFRQTGKLVVRIFARDKDGGETVKEPLIRVKKIVEFSAPRLVADVVRIGGTESDDHLTLRLNEDDYLEATLGGVTDNFISSRILIVHMGSGNDVIDVLGQPLEGHYYGDGGSDTLNGKPIK